MTNDYHSSCKFPETFLETFPVNGQWVAKFVNEFARFVTNQRMTIIRPLSCKRFQKRLQELPKLAGDLPNLARFFGHNSGTERRAARAASGASNGHCTHLCFVSVLFIIIMYSCCHTSRLRACSCAYSTG